MFVNNFANIGNAVLIKALGLQKNYIEVIENKEDVIDEDGTGCLSCVWKELNFQYLWYIIIDNLIATVVY